MTTLYKLFAIIIRIKVNYKYVHFLLMNSATAVRSVPYYIGDPKRDPYFRELPQ